MSRLDDCLIPKVNNELRVAESSRRGRTEELVVSFDKAGMSSGEERSLWEGTGS